MSQLYIDCHTGVAGDMLLSAMFDLAVPEEVVHRSLSQLGLKGCYKFVCSEASSRGMRGLRTHVQTLEPQPMARDWSSIRADLVAAAWPDGLRERVLQVFTALAKAESQVHGCSIERVHFHEVGAIDALVDVVGVCAALEHLGITQIFCTPPPAGHGSVQGAHGELPVPAPAVLELARLHRVPLQGSRNLPPGELTTPTGLALIATQVSSFVQPASLPVAAIGVGLGHRQLNCPNFLRVCLLDTSSKARVDTSSLTSPASAEMLWQSIVVQEAWIDDITAEDLALLGEELRNAGALDVSWSSVGMKKGRSGVEITALVLPEYIEELRRVWFCLGSTLGLRERQQGRWLLPRREGQVCTSLGVVRLKQVRRPGKRLTFKLEHDDLVQISRAMVIPLETVRQIVMHELETGADLSLRDWTW